MGEGLIRGVVGSLVAWGLLTGVAASASTSRTVAVVATPNRPAGLYVFGARVLGSSGTQPVALRGMPTGSSSLSADGHTLLYQVVASRRIRGGTTGSGLLRVRSLATGEDEIAVTDGIDPTFRPGGGIVYLREEFRQGVGRVRFQPVERSNLRSAPVALGPAAYTAGGLFPVAGGRALSEVTTSMAATGVEVLAPGRSPRRVLPRTPRSGVVAISPNGSRALLWYSQTNQFWLAVVATRDGRTLSRVDTHIGDQHPPIVGSARGGWVAGRIVASFRSQIVVAAVHNGIVGSLEHLDLPKIRDLHGDPVAIEPQWIRFQDASSKRVVFAADIAEPNLGGIVDLNLFACDVAQTRCLRFRPRETGPVTMAPSLTPVDRAGSGVVAR